MRIKTVLAFMLLTFLIIGCSSDSKSLSVSPSKVDFGEVYIGDSIDVVLTLKNKYGKDITISTLTIAGSSDVSITQGSVPIYMAKGTEYQITLKFEPMTSGPINALLTISHDGSTKDKEITIVGDGVPIPRIKLSETSFDFTKKIINKTHDHVFEIENIGTSDLDISGLNFVGAGAAVYSITAGNAPAKITPGTKHAFTVTFSPVSVGTYKADLLLNHNGINEPNPITIPIDGEGIDVDPQITLSTGTNWDFGSVATTLPGIQVVEIDNSGTDPLTVTSATFTTGAEYSIYDIQDSNGSSVNLPQLIAVGGHILIFVKFAPATKTTFNDTLSIVHDGTNEPTPLDVALTGLGRDEITKSFSYTGTIENWVVPAKVGYIRIEAWGAAGGGTRCGKGARVRGDFMVTPGETIKLIVAENGYVTAQGDYGAGGGGASYIYRDASDPLPLLVAAGGGGQIQNVSGYNYTGGDGSHTDTPTPGQGTGSGNGGTGGNGGDGGQVLYNYSTGGGGAGWLTDGKDGVTVRNPQGEGGSCPKNGALGGVFTHSSSSYCVGNAGDGGFGGGGGMSDNSGAGGGGAGFNGGGGGNNYAGSSRWGSGGGGGSYNGGLNPDGTSGTQSGHGKIVITY